jgi:hypothetical protein
MNAARLSSMEAYTDEGDRLSHENGIELLCEAIWLRKAIAAFQAHRGRHEGGHETAAYSPCAKCEESYIKAEAVLDASLLRE